MAFPSPSPAPAREVHDAAELSALLADGAPLAGVRLQGVDLAACEAGLLQRGDLSGLVVLGGAVTPDLAAHLIGAGAILFPAAPDVPVDPYRAHLYLPEELYAGLEQGYAGTPDARAHAWSRDAALAHDVYASALRALHDDAMADALDEALAGSRVVGVMGGHATARGHEDFTRAAHLGERLARAGLVVATGGGPGAMEAANLGALAAHSPDPGVLGEALLALAATPAFADVTQWASVGLRVREQVLASYGAGLPPYTVGLPTWFYGHEPPNVFASGIAKFFSNAVREDGLLARCDAGVIVLPGAAGTVQEIFQAVTPRYYGTAAHAPLVLVGRDYWTRAVPVWAPLQALARDRDLHAILHVVDRIEDAATLVGA